MLFQSSIVRWKGEEGRKGIRCTVVSLRYLEEGFRERRGRGRRSILGCHSQVAETTNKKLEIIEIGVRLVKVLFDCCGCTIVGICPVFIKAKITS